jgi:succinate dehydrogenase/fumarate reductase flavoprotein subunit
MDQPVHDSTTTDVLILGAGPAGMAAAAAAAAAGQEVTVVERRDVIGGNSAWSTGYLAFVDTPMQRTQGIVDSEEFFMRDAAAAVASLTGEYPVHWDRELTLRFARLSAATFSRLQARGVVFSRFIDRPQQHTVRRMCAVQDPAMLPAAFASDFRRSNVRTLLGHAAQRLLAADDHVAGAVVVSSDGASLIVRARRGVVLTTGGYQANHRLRARFFTAERASRPFVGIDTSRGDGHLMGQAVGGDLMNMAVVPELVMVSSSLIEDAIAVNLDGQRFHDECGPYANRLRALSRQPQRRAWYLFDQETHANKRELVEQMPEPPAQADTLAGLAQRLEVDEGRLSRTVDAWNRLLATPDEPDCQFGRVVMPRERRPIRRPPFFASPMIVGADFGSGGFRVTDDMQVVSVWGRPIRGLFAAGDCVAGINPTASLGGIHLSGALTLGHVAGESAAASVHDEHEFPAPFSSSNGDGPSALRIPLVAVPTDGF